MQNLLASANPPTGSQLYFNLLGDPMNPNGGLLARFAGLDLPTLGMNFYGATPANTPWTTNIYTLEYDGFADFPRYPIDILSDLNAVAGIIYVHPTYPNLDPRRSRPATSLNCPCHRITPGPSPIPATTWFSQRTCHSWIHCAPYPSWVTRWQICSNRI